MTNRLAGQSCPGGPTVDTETGPRVDLSSRLKSGRESQTRNLRGVVKGTYKRIDLSGLSTTNLCHGRTEELLPE